MAWLCVAGALVFSNSCASSANIFLPFAPFIGSQALLPGTSPVTGTWDALVVRPVQFKEAKVPGVGMLSVTRNT
jgi:hypothetical protein